MSPVASKVIASSHCPMRTHNPAAFGRYSYLRLLLLLSHFSRVQLCATPWTAAHQAPPSRQEHWRGLPFPSLVHESEK